MMKKKIIKNNKINAYNDSLSLLFFCFSICLLLQTCKSVFIQKDKDCLIINNNKFYSIHLSDNLDSIDGYYCIKSDSFFYMSQKDLHEKSILCKEEKIKPYLWFVLDNTKKISLRRHKCDKFNEKKDYYVPINNSVFVKKVDEIFIFEHISKADTTNINPLVRTFYIDGNCNVIDFRSTGKNNKYYFYYD